MKTQGGFCSTLEIENQVEPTSNVNDCIHMIYVLICSYWGWTIWKSVFTIFKGHFAMNMTICLGIQNAILNNLIKGNSKYMEIPSMVLD